MEETWWTTQELGALRQMLRQGATVKEIAQKLGRTEKAVRNKTSKLGWSFLLQQREPPRVETNAANVKCPFFCSFLEQKRIRCEGAGRAQRTILLFRKEEDWTYHVHTFCDRGFESCPVARMLTEKYQ